MSARRLIACLALASLALTGTACEGGSGSGKTSKSSKGKTGKKSKTGKATKAAKAVRVGQEARDGKFAFTITKVRPGVRKVGSGILAQKPQGEFVLVAVTVRNIGDEAQMFIDTEQKAADSGGKEFTPSTEAAVVLNQKTGAFLSDINPGNSVKGLLAFDVPTGTRLASLELHDSAFSDGVKVTLTP
ncbi:DUF4352 domain-containing protein [Spirillospora sp. NPDC048911]|uniref:DUF4352 domain-containing protein n=1 Tax=Spirillospora sp. NPDC048911 TaxID=3364527 RepID=UPI003721A486